MSAIKIAARDFEFLCSLTLDAFREVNRQIHRHIHTGRDTGRATEKRLKGGQHAHGDVGMHWFLSLIPVSGKLDTANGQIGR